MKKRIVMAFSIVALFIITILPFSFLPIALADDSTDIVQESLVPQPVNPKNNEKDVAITPVDFTWNRVVNTTKYQIEIGTGDDMKSIFSANVTATGYRYYGTLKYNTSYWWHVKGSDPPGDWSNVSWFTTQAKSTGNVALAASDNKTSDNTSSSSPNIFKGLDWKLVLPIGIGLLAIILIIVYFSLPKKSSPPGQRGGRQQAYGPPTVVNCPSCGAENNFGQPFCWDCGSPLPPPGQPQWGPPQPGLCLTCGALNPPGRPICGSCGAPLMGRGPQQPPPSPPPPPRGGGPICPRCGATNMPGRKFCGSCGAAMIVRPPAPPPPPPMYGAPRQQPPPQMYGDPRMQPPPPQGWQQQQAVTNCPLCGTPNPIGRGFCANCGADLAARQQPPPAYYDQGQQQAQHNYTCPSCNRPIPYGAPACPSCGVRLEW